MLMTSSNSWRIVATATSQCHSAHKTRIAYSALLARRRMPTSNMTKGPRAVVVGKLDADEPTLRGGRDVDEQPQQPPEALVRWPNALHPRRERVALAAARAAFLPLAGHAVTVSAAVARRPCATCPRPALRLLPDPRRHARPRAA